MELQERIQPYHKEMFQRMLGIKGELPEFLLKEYFSMKKLLDKVDGFMNPFDLVMIALRCGFDPDTMLFTSRIIENTAAERYKETPTMPPVENTPADVPPEDENEPTEEAGPVPHAVELYVLGENVEIMQNEGTLSGKIVGLPTDKKTTYTVLCDDFETYEVEPENIEDN